MKKYLFVLCLSIIYFYGNAQEILNAITSVHIDGTKIDRDDKNLIVNIKEQEQKYVFTIQYKNVKTIFPIFYSELHGMDSISIIMNSFAKKRAVDIPDFDNASP